MPPATCERRNTSIPVEFRDNGQGKLPTVRGYAAVFNSVADSGWGWREKIQTGAFAESLRASDLDVVALVEHDTRLVVARTGGTLKLGEDQKGLWYEFTPSDTQVGRDLVQNLRDGNIRQSSFGFSTEEDSWDRKPADGGDPLRTLVRVKLYDVSPVVFPFYPATDAGVRSFYQGIRDRGLAAPAPTGRPNLLAADIRLAEIGAR